MRINNKFKKRKKILKKNNKKVCIYGKRREIQLCQMSFFFLKKKKIEKICITYTDYTARVYISYISM